MAKTGNYAPTTQGGKPHTCVAAEHGATARKPRSEKRFNTRSDIENRATTQNARFSIKGNRKKEDYIA